MRFAAARRWPPGRLVGVFLVLVLAVSVLLGTIPGPVLADDGDEDEVRAGIQAQGTVTVAGRTGMPPGLAKKLAAWRFDDEDEVGWGHEYMAKMRAKGLIKGVGNNRFAPGANLTRVEAVVMAVRLMGLEEEAQERSGARLGFANAAEVSKKYPWAVGYLDVAEENDLLDHLLKEGYFPADKPATRLDVVVLLVKAMGLEDEALAKDDVRLTFRDAAAIPADLVGYVAVAMEEGIVQGYQDGTFQPNKPVKRVEMAALLDRADWVLPPRSPYHVEGRLVEVDEDESTLTLDVVPRWWPWPATWRIRPRWLAPWPVPAGGGYSLELDARGKVRIVLPVELVSSRQEYEVSGDALILLDGKPVELGDLPAGAWTRLVLNTDKVALVVDARSAGVTPPAPPSVSRIKGTVTAIDEDDGTITVRTEDGNRVTLRLAEEVRVVYGDEYVGLDEVKVGDRVQLRLENQEVVRIIIAEREEEEEEIEEFEGTIRAISTASDGTVTLKVYAEDGEVLTAPVAENAVITYDGNPLPVEDLLVGDRVELELEDGVIVEIEVGERPQAALTGEIASISRSGDRWTIRLEDAAGNSFTYRLSAQVRIRRGSTELDVDDLDVGDQVRVKVSGSLVYEIEVLE